MLLGRRRRYFGYPRDLNSFIDTPQSAKSYASHVSAIPSLKAAYIKIRKQEIKPDPPLPRRYADRNLHRAIATQIPALLPPLKNTFRFKEIEDRPINFHNPQLEHHFERSLYYIWLSKNDRHELCQIVDAHLGSRGRGGHKRPGAKTEYRDIGNPIQRPAPVDYSNMPRNLSVLDETSPHSKNMKSKFQKGIWDPPKTPRDRFVQDHGKSPAMDSICHAYPVNQKTKVNEKDIQDCILAARKLLGPYAGINTTIGSHEDIPDELVDLIDENNKLQKEEEIKKREMGFAKRPFGYNSSQIKYEKQISSAIDYYNKIKLGARHPTPPAEIFGNLEKYKDKTVAKSLAKLILQEEKNKRKSVKTGVSPTVPKRKFNKANIIEEDYMDIYLHYLADTDVSVKNPIRSLTDITKLRKKMHLDEEPGADEDINDLVRADSFSDIPDDVDRRLLKGEIDPLQTKDELAEEDRNIVKEILGAHFEKLQNPQMRKIFAKFSNPSMVRSSPSYLKGAPTPALDDLEEEEINEDDEKLERNMGMSFKDAEEVLSVMQLSSKQTDSFIDSSLASLSDTDASSLNVEVVKIPPGQACSSTDLDCLSREGALGTPPFGKSSRQRKISAEKLGTTISVQDTEDEDLDANMFSNRNEK